MTLVASQKTCRVLYRAFEEDFYDRVRGYRGTNPYEKALRKRSVWVEPLFAEAKNWHGMRKCRLRRLKKVNIEAFLLLRCGSRMSILDSAGREYPILHFTAKVLHVSWRELSELDAPNSWDCVAPYLTKRHTC